MNTRRPHALPRSRGDPRRSSTSSSIRRTERARRGDHIYQADRPYAAQRSADAAGASRIESADDRQLRGRLQHVDIDGRRELAYVQHAGVLTRRRGSDDGLILATTRRVVEGDSEVRRTALHLGTLHLLGTSCRANASASSAWGASERSGAASARVWRRSRRVRVGNAHELLKTS